MGKGAERHSAADSGFTDGWYTGTLYEPGGCIGRVVEDDVVYDTVVV